MGAGAADSAVTQAAAAAAAASNPLQLSIQQLPRWQLKHNKHYAMLEQY
jgi:hypothetical protein